MEDIVKKILLIEDDRTLSQGIVFLLTSEGYEVSTAHDFKQGLKSALDGEIDLILLDVNLPDGSGYDICRQVKRKRDLPIIFLTALDEEVHIVLGLDIGGEDYIVKPFRAKELLSRIRAVFRRFEKSADEPAPTVLQSGALRIDTRAARIEKEGKTIELTAGEYRLLLSFLHSPEQILSREHLLQSLTEDAAEYFDENTLAVYIRRLREKLEEDPKRPEYILTRRGQGYLWNREVKR